MNELEKYQEYQDFAIVFHKLITEAVLDRNPEPIWSELDAHANESGELSNADLALIGIWRGLFKEDVESFLWIGYILSIKKGYENLTAYFFICSQQHSLLPH